MLNHTHHAHFCILLLDQWSTLSIQRLRALPNLSFALVVVQEVKISSPVTKIRTDHKHRFRVVQVRGQRSIHHRYTPSLLRVLLLLLLTHTSNHNHHHLRFVLKEVMHEGKLNLQAMLSLLLHHTTVTVDALQISDYASSLPIHSASSVLPHPRREHHMAFPILLRRSASNNYISLYRDEDTEYSNDDTDPAQSRDPHPFPVYVQTILQQFAQNSYVTRKWNEYVQPAWGTITPFTRSSPEVCTSLNHSTNYVRISVPTADAFFHNRCFSRIPSRYSTSESIPWSSKTTSTNRIHHCL